MDSRPSEDIPIPDEPIGRYSAWLDTLEDRVARWIDQPADSGPGLQSDARLRQTVVTLTALRRIIDTRRALAEWSQKIESSRKTRSAEDDPDGEILAAIDRGIAEGKIRIRQRTVP